MGVRKVLSLLAVMVLVAGCSHKPDDSGAVTTSSDNTTLGAPMNGASPVSPVSGSAVPGSEQDLVTSVGDRVFFGYNQYDLTSEARATIEKQAQWLKTYPNVNVMVEGHCDERGTREYNLALGEKRAMAERNYLIALGIDSKRIQTISYGKERPAVMGSDESSWAQNRRAVMVVQ
jgi:peptidoglycan-associated lipoprotein